MYKSIRQVPIKIEDKSFNRMFEELIRDHLEHSGYFGTLKALDNSLGKKIEL